MLDHISDDLLHSIVAPKVVHHVAFGAEALSAVLGAVKRPVVVVHADVNREIMPIVEALSAACDWTDENCSRLVIGQVGLQVLARPEFLRAIAIGALKDLWNLHNLAILASEALIALGVDIRAESVR